MWARVVVIAACITGCYAPRVAPGTPCEPSAGCPYDYTCALVDGEHICVDTPPGPDVDATPPAPRWTIVQTRGRETRELELESPTTMGNVIIVAVERTSGDFANQVSDDLGNDYERLNASRARDNTENLGIELWLAAEPMPGATRISAQGGTVFALAVWEVAGIQDNNPVAATAREDNQASSDRPSGAPITTTEPGQFVLSIAIVANRVERLVDGSPFTNDHDTFGNGWAHLTDPFAPADTYTAQWIQPEAGTSCASSVAFRVRD